MRVIPVCTVATDPDGKKVRTFARGKQIVLRPGINVVPDDVWAMVKDTPGVKQAVELGIYVPLDGGKGKEFSITTSHPDDALEISRRTIDPAALRQMIEDVQTSPKLHQGQAAQKWQQVLDQLRENLREATTDGHGNPVEPRQIQPEGL